ncbi:MAG: hypothetical protein MUF06_10835, partial [Pirellulaceae bacterium]|nr:hypothetical protein [Pirellulaceae bacterium]
PKFNMYKRILAKVLAERFVVDRGWSEEQAVDLGKQVLRGNVEKIFRWGEDLRGERPAESVEKRYFIDPLSASVTEATGQVLAPADDIRIEPPQEGSDESLLAESPDPAIAPAEPRDPRMTMQFPTAEEIAAASDELELDELQVDESAALEPSTGSAANEDLEPLAELSADELAADSLELIDEPTAAEAESGTLSLEEEGTPESRDTFSIRQTEPFRQYGQEEETPAEEPKEKKTEPGGWDFLK